MSALAEVAGEDLRVRFGAPWDLDGHRLFLKAKGLPEARCEFDRAQDCYTLVAPARFAHVLGVAGTLALPTRSLPMNERYQRWVVGLALEAKRFAAWEDCGLGKTFQFLEWARQVCHRTGGRVLILSPKQIIRQTQGEAERFYGSFQTGTWPVFLETREVLIEWCRSGISHGSRGRSPSQSGDALIAITNYEKFIPGVIDEVRWCAGVALDESSILKGGGGVIKWNLIKSCRGVEYKWSGTATPAPNDTIEYASQASFLEKMRTDNEIIWTYFVRDQKTQEWRVRPHARDAFYRFMAGWSIYLRKPSLYGFKDQWDLPEPEIVEHRIPMTPEQGEWFGALSRESGSLFGNERLGIRERSKFSQIAKGFIYGESKSKSRIKSKKPEVVAQLMAEAVKAGRRPLCWTVFDEESEVLMELLQGTGILSLHGSDKDAAREEKLEAYRTGNAPGLVSKARLLGYGMNFPFCQEMVFSGFDDSFEQFYQAIRRAHRVWSNATVAGACAVCAGAGGSYVAEFVAEERAVGGRRGQAGGELCESDFNRRKRRKTEREFKTMILAIDPGPSESAFVAWDDERSTVMAQIYTNSELLLLLERSPWQLNNTQLNIEMVACYGMPVGKEVFETVRWIGRFEQVWGSFKVRLVYRQEVKLHHCKSARAKDSNIRQALIDKYGAPGTKNAPGATYGLKSHLWSAFAIATYVAESAQLQTA